MNLPVDFEAKARAAKSASGGGYPVQLSAADLMRNFVFAAGEFKEEEFEITESTGESSQHTTRKISLKNSLVGTDQGNIPFWNKDLNEGLGGWQMIAPPTKPGEFLYWDVEANSGAGGWSLHDPAGEGTLVYFSADAKEWKSFVPADPCVIFYKDKEWQSLAVPEGGDDPLQLTATYVLGAVDGALQWIATEEC